MATDDDDCDDEERSPATRRARDLTRPERAELDWWRQFLLHFRQGDGPRPGMVLPGGRFSILRSDGRTTTAWPKPGRLAELADFEPSTGHRHDCPLWKLWPDVQIVTEYAAGEPLCDCAEQLYCVAAQLSEEAAHVRRGH